MPKSSIHFENGHIGFFYHNSRENPTKNSIFSTEYNYTNKNAKESIQEFYQLLEVRTAKYTELKKRKLHKKTITHHSAIINLPSPEFDEQGNIKDSYVERCKTIVEQVAECLENDTYKDKNNEEKKLYGGKLIQYSLHFDEGWIDVNKQKHYNTHAHLEFLSLDENGMACKQNLDKKSLMIIQDRVAEISGLERGVNHIKEKKKRSIRLSTYDYKAHARAEYATAMSLKSKTIEEANKIIAKHKTNIKNLAKENSELKSKIEDLEKSTIGADESFFDKLAKVKDLKATIKELRAELQQNKATREDYAKLEQLAKNLKIQVKNKDLTIKQLESRIELFKSDDISSLRDKARQYDEISSNYEEVREFVLEANKQLQIKDDEIEELKEENQELKRENAKLSQELEEVKKELNNYKNMRYVDRKAHKQDIQELRKTKKEIEKDIENLYDRDI